MRLATEIFNELLLPPFVSPDTFSIGSHTGLAHPIVIGGNLFFLLSVMKLIYLTNAESTRVYRFFFVIFIPNEILGEKIILTKTHIRIQRYGRSLGVVKWKRVQHQLWAIWWSIRSSQKWETSQRFFFQQSIVLLALRKKCTTTTNVQNFTSIEQKIRLFLKYFCGQISKKKNWMMLGEK